MSMPCPLLLLAFLTPVLAPVLVPAAHADPASLGVRDGLEVIPWPEAAPRVFRTRAAVVIALRPGVPVPPELVARGQPLGGLSWRLPTLDPVAAAKRWAALPGVAAADPDVLLPRRSTAFDDPGFGGQWYLERLGMEALYAVSLGAPEVRIAVIDSGIQIAHPDLEAGVDAPFDAVDDDADPSPHAGEFCPEDVHAVCDEHGTAVAGIVGARADNGTGIVGLCPECTLIPIRLISESEMPLSADVAAFEHAISQDAWVINNSWGFTEAIPVPGTLAAVIHRAATEPRGGRGALVVFAAGNDDRAVGDDELTALADVLSVSAADSYGRPTAYTNRGRSVDVCAPSATVTLSPGAELLTTFGGTSAAAPVVAGLAGWALSVAPELSAAELHALLIETAVQSPLITPDADGHHDVFGFGMVSPAALLERLVPTPVEPDAGPPDASPAPFDAAPSSDATTSPLDGSEAKPPDASVATQPADMAAPDSGGAASDGGGSGGCMAAPVRRALGTPGWAALAVALLALTRLRRPSPGASGRRAQSSPHER